MQPEGRENKSQRGVARARALLKKNLGWLPGFPEMGTTSNEVRWCAGHSSSSNSVVLDRESLRRAEMVLTKLRHRFPHALPKVVEDVDDWLRRMDFSLELIKGAVHGDSKIKAEDFLKRDLLAKRQKAAFAELLSSYPELKPLLNATLSMQMTGRNRPDKNVFDWIGQNAEALSRISTVQLAHSSVLDLQRLLCRIRTEVPQELMRVLVECFANQDAWSLPSHGFFQLAESLSKHLRNVANGVESTLPKKTSGQCVGQLLQELLVDLLQLKRKPRRRAFDLLNALIPSSLSESISFINMHVAEEESRLLRELRRLAHRYPPIASTKSEKKRIKEFANVSVDIKEAGQLDSLVLAIRHVPATAVVESLSKTWSRFLNRFSDEDCHVSAGLFQRWETQRQQSKNEQVTSELRQVLELLCNLIEDCGFHSALKSHWESCLAHGGFWEQKFVESLLGRDYSRKLIAKAVGLLREVLRDGSVKMESDLFGSLIEFAHVELPLKTAASVVSNLTDCDDAFYPRHQIRTALTVSQDPVVIAGVLEFLNENYDYQDDIRFLASHLSGVRRRIAFVNAVVENRKSTIQKLAICSRMLKFLELSVREISKSVVESNEWLKRYPSELHDPILELVRVNENGRKIVEELLEKQFPSDGKLTREITVLQRKLEENVSVDHTNRLLQRLENLKGRLKRSVPTASPRRLENLKRKLLQRADFEVVQQFLAVGKRLITNRLKEVYGIDTSLESFLDPPYDQLLANVVQLEKGTRDLGLCLLLNHTKGSVREFEVDARNVAFRTRVESKGILMEPWLSDSFRSTAKTASGETYTLAFTRENLDYLLMGYHFDTCLSPDSCNFFSTIANAVDINKQVVYGKTIDGRIIGRCLFTLSNVGAIQTYNRYSREKSDGFDRAIDQFAGKLACAMKTFVDCSSDISRIVAKEWYDDGAVDSASVRDYRSPGGAFHELLRNESPRSSVVQGLLELLGSEAALLSAMGGLLWDEELAKHPAAVREFIDGYAANAELSFQSRFRLAILAHKVKWAGAFRDILARLRPNSLPLRLSRINCCYSQEFHGIGSYQEVFDLLIDFSPTIALRTIRSSRDRNVVCDRDERNWDRRKSLSKIHQRLGRTNLAAQLGRCEAPDNS